jgi:predicted nucleic acid-binding protein
MIHLDTSFLIRGGVRGTPEDLVLRRWRRKGTVIGISAIAWAEYLCGPLSKQAVESAAELLGQPRAFDALDATLAAQLFNTSGRRRGTLPDCMIAAIAINAQASLATSNRVDFERFTGVGLVLARLF